MDTRTRGRSGPAIQLKRILPRLFVVTDDDVVQRPDFQKQAERVLAAGAGQCALHVRAPGLGGTRIFDHARRLKTVAERYEADLWVNDRVDVALAVRADGVQLGWRSMAFQPARRLLGCACWIGRSIHSAEEAAALDADVFLLGSVFATPSHPGRAPLGLGALEKAKAWGRPIVAIGGITPERTREVIEAGAWGIAILGGVWRARDPAAGVALYVQALEDSLTSAGEGDASTELNDG